MTDESEMLKKLETIGDILKMIFWMLCAGAGVVLANLGGVV